MRRAVLAMLTLALLAVWLAALQMLDRASAAFPERPDAGNMARWRWEREHRDEED